MSCGQPHEMDCLEVIEQVYIYLDGECGEADRARIREHLDECGPCLREFGIEQEVKALVARCCGSDAAPDGLRERVLVRLQQVRVEISSVEFRYE
jgi:mycothiol system anti-sigma-R factor